jgi:aryl-alcohol dehydrogenase-like predicted oxidoreductase
MNHRIIGKSTLSVSEIGFGCMSLRENIQENSRLIHQAFDSGIIFFDTADIYQNGENEKQLGIAVREIRKELIIATKVGNIIRADGKGLDWDPSKKHILAAAEASLKRLGTDYIDLYQLHGGTIDDPIDETIEAFETLKQQGKIRNYGISSIRPNVIREYVKRSNIISVMMQYSLLDRRPEESVLSLLQESNISILARGVLTKGLLINKAPEPYLNYSKEEIQKIAKQVVSLSNEKRNPSQILLNFALSNPTVTTAVIGIRNTSQLLDAIKPMMRDLLTRQEMDGLLNSLTALKYEQHR